MMGFLGRRSLFFFLILSFVSLLLFFLPRIREYIKAYTILAIENQFGSEPVPLDIEHFVKQIARSMHIDDEIRIRKMNETGLSLGHSHNAFAIPSNLWGILPLSDTPFLYLSIDFFQHLSKEEQRFLIGHELIHLRDRHTRFLPLLYIVSILCAIMLLFLVINRFCLLYDRRFVNRFSGPVELWAGLQILKLLIILIISFCVILIPVFGRYAYLRRIERYADLQSVALLKSHGGGIALVNRWIKDYGEPILPFLVTDHPSLRERKKYLLNALKTIE